jgi:hypothetical protein
MNLLLFAETATSTPIYSSDPDVQAYVARMSTPISEATITKMDTLVGSIKTALSISDLSERLVFYYIMGHETEEASLMNLVSANFDLIKNGTPTWTQWEGYLGNGTDSFFDTQYNTTTDIAAYPAKLNSISVGIYCRTTGNGEWIAMGNNDGAGGAPQRDFRMIIGWSNTYSYYNLNQESLGSDLSTLSSVPRSYHIVTYDGTTGAAYRNATERASKTYNAGVLPNLNLYLMASRTTTGAANFEERQFSHFFLGNRLTPTEVTAMNNAFEVYMDSNGKGIIA